jgi:hypothetical protein
MDYPLVRASSDCPLCYAAKDRGLVVCWECYKAFHLRNGNADAENLIALAERVFQIGKAARAGEQGS